MRSLMIALSVVAALLAGCDFLNSTPRLGVVDMTRIIQDSGPGRLALSQSAKAQEILQTNLNAIQAKVATYPDKQQAKEILAGAHADLQQRLQKEQSAISAQVTQQLRKVIRDYQAEHKLDLIVSKDAVLEYGTAVDITPAVLAMFEAGNLALPPLPKLDPNPALPAPKAAPAPAAAKAPEKNVKKEAPQQSRQPVRNRKRSQ